MVLAQGLSCCSQDVLGLQSSEGLTVARRSASKMAPHLAGGRIPGFHTIWASLQGT